MKVLSPRGPWSAEEVVDLARIFQFIINETVDAAGLKPLMRGGGTIYPRVYPELTHPDMWTINSNDPDHPELEELCKADIEAVLVTPPANSPWHSPDFELLRKICKT